MTLPEVMDLFDYWRSNPPVHEMVAAYLGIKGDHQKTASTPSMTDLQTQMALVNGG